MQGSDGFECERLNRQEQGNQHQRKDHNLFGKIPSQAGFFECSYEQLW